jgi:hypothetical protein
LAWMPGGGVVRGGGEAHASIAREASEWAALERNEFEVLAEEWAIRNVAW